MFNRNHLHTDESGQTALETAIILIAFVVVASVFAFTILSAGSESTERGEDAIQAGLEGVQSSMTVSGSIRAMGDTATDPPTMVDTVVFTLRLVGDGDPVNLTDNDADDNGAIDADANNVVIIGYTDNGQFVNEVPWNLAWVGANDGDTLLEEDELAEITVTLTGLTTRLGPTTEFALEIKPPTGAVIPISLTTPAGLEDVMELD